MNATDDKPRFTDGTTVPRDLLNTPMYRKWLEERGVRFTDPGRPCEGRPHVTTRDD